MQGHQKLNLITKNTPTNDVLNGNLFLLTATLELMNYELQVPQIFINRYMIMLSDFKYLLFTGRNDCLYWKAVFMVPD